MDIASFSSDSRAVIKISREVATDFRHTEIGIEHLLVAVLRHEGSEVLSILNQLGKNPVTLAAGTEAFLKDQSSRSAPRGNVNIGPAVENVLVLAAEEKSKLFDPLVEPHHIFIAIFDPRSTLSPVVRERCGVTKEDFYGAIAESKSIAEIAAGSKVESETGDSSKPAADIAGTLRYCVDITNQAAAGEFDPMIGRQAEVHRLIQILLRRRKNNPVLVGGAGVGKSAIVEGFAQAVIAGQVPAGLLGVQVLEVDMGALVAGAKYKGEFEERFKNLVGEVVKSGGRIVLFIDELHTIAGAGNGGGGMDAANLIKPALARGHLRLIGATTEEEYTKHIEKDKALDRRFERVKVDAPDFEDTVKIIQGVVGNYQDHHKLDYTDAAITGAVKFAQRYLSERNLPDVALDLVDEAASSFLVREDFAQKVIPAMEQQIQEIQELIKSSEQAKGPEEESGRSLQDVYDEFGENLDRLQEYWGHRVHAN